MIEKKSAKIARNIAGIFGIYLILVFVLFLSDSITSLSLISSLLGAILSLLNIIIAFLLFRFSYPKSNEKFLKFNLGGMFARVALILIAVFLILKFLSIDEYGFIFTLFVLYFVFLIFEITFFAISQKK